MRRLADALYAVCVTLWVGGMWTVGYLVAPVLFRTLGDRMLAGEIAGRLFALIAWIGIGCAAYLLLHLFARRGAAAFKSGVFWVVLAMLLMVLAGHFGIQPILAQLKAQAALSGAREVMESLVRNRFAAWHGVSSILYLVQSLLGLVLVLIQNRGR